MELRVAGEKMEVDIVGGGQKPRDKLKHMIRIKTQTFGLRSWTSWQCSGGTTGKNL